MTRVLVVEDNADLAYGLRNNLEIEGYEVQVAEDGPAGLAGVRAGSPELVILDLMLPGTDGFRVLKALREEGHGMPVLILTARSEEADKVRGLKMGADDYITKPFGLLELLARVEALLRRAGDGVGPAEAATARERFGGVEVEARTRSVFRRGRPVDLAPKEFDLLLALLRAKGGVVSRLDLMTQVWGYSAAVVSRTVDTHVAELRRKLEDRPAAHPDGAEDRLSAAGVNRGRPAWKRSSPTRSSLDRPVGGMSSAGPGRIVEVRPLGSRPCKKTPAAETI